MEVSIEGCKGWTVSMFGDVLVTRKSVKCLTSAVVRVAERTRRVRVSRNVCWAAESCAPLAHSASAVLATWSTLSFCKRSNERAKSVSAHERIRHIAMACYMFTMLKEASFSRGGKKERERHCAQSNSPLPTRRKEMTCHYLQETRGKAVRCIPSPL